MPQTRQMPSPAASSSQVLQVPDEQSAIRISGTLRLRGEDNSNSSGINTGSAPNRHIRWSQDVVDNEGMGKKSSKVCCIYHKPRPVGESSSESESDSDSNSDSDSETDHYQNKPNHLQHRLGHNESSHHQHSSEQNSEKGHTACNTKHCGKQGKQRKPSPNAYEKMPKPSKGHHKSQGA
ncbi:PPP1R11/YPI1 family protein [Aspergillus chevalieri]|uniref:Type 1 phosphatases regulator n=1 Tax=Aspergillus chevalieri TaxID=182096 RepID=A0A7R7VN76_ASPCH|nr:type 1 phosphatases regulator Ypi1 [Aspergillus chevalieri]BCR87023.1 type 1 phosphatases regulator Ypi1 [Aspergillus chevalieri]